jgi:hypothetical protein
MRFPPHPRILVSPSRGFSLLLDCDIGGMIVTSQKCGSIKIFCNNLEGANIFCHVEKVETKLNGLEAEGDSPKLLNITAWQLRNQLGSVILLQFPHLC